MISQMRGKVGGWIVMIIIGFIALVFAFEGVFRPSATNGLHEGAVAGTINGESVSISEYNRELERKLEFLKGITGGTVTEEQMKMFRVRDSVFQEIVQRKLMAQAALKSGRQPSDEAVRQEIINLPYFQKDGKFDPAQYRATLAANNYSTAMFEKMIREQLAVEEWSKSFSTQVRVSETEVKDEYLASKNTRSFKFVSIPVDAPKAGDLTPKAAAEKVAALISGDKKSDAAVNAVLKPFNVTVRDSGETSAASGMVPGAQDHPELTGDLFGDKLTVGKSKVYESPTRITVVYVTSAKKADLSKFEAEKKETQLQIRARKERELMGEVLKKLQENSKIVSNPAVVGETAPEAA